MKNTKKCIKCNKEFLTYNDGKFCSRECYYLHPKPPRSESHKILNKIQLKKYYNSKDWEEKKKERGKKISSSLTKHYSEEEILILETLLKEQYISDKKILAKKVNKNSSYKRVDNAFLKYPKLLELYNKRFPFSPKKVQILSIDEWYYFKKCFKTQNITEFCENFKIDKKTHRRLSAHYFELVPRKYTRKQESKPEKIFKELLELNNCEFEKEVLFKNKYVIDFVIGNIAIEIQGDYWHGNPKFYTKENLNNQQKRHIIRDSLKKDLILKNDYLFIEIWENDLYNKKEKINKLIKIIKNGKYHRKFYSTNSWK